MSERITGTFEAWREHGVWRVKLHGPYWLLADFRREWEVKPIQLHNGPGITSSLSMIDQPQTMMIGSLSDYAIENMKPDDEARPGGEEDVR